ncbi:hypothetical protein H4R24_002218 [Coemansia sp. RSA 988]|nr:hypothetical protein H4R24_002218 [Coemansia sp. RSA 988]
MAELNGIQRFFVRALYPFKSEETSGLTFDRGEIIEVLACLESGWWNGICKNNRGWFPSNYVEHVSAEQVQLLRQAQQTQSQYQPQQQQYAQQALQAQQIQQAQHVQQAQQAQKTQQVQQTQQVHHAQQAQSVQQVQQAQPVQQVQQQQSRQPGGSDVENITSITSPADQSLLTAAANESVYRRGSIATSDTQAGIASAVPPRLRMGRRGSTPLNVANGSEQDGMVAEPPHANSASVIPATGNGEGAHVAQWESRTTLEGRTYYCNIFTDKTVWSLGDVAAQGPAGTGLELIGDEATLVYVALVLGQQRDAGGAARADSSTVEDGATGTWDQLAASVSLAALALAGAVSAQAKHEYSALVLQAVAGVKRLLLASAGGAAHGGPLFRTHRLLRERHKDVVQHVGALVLSARVAATVWPPPDAADAVHADIAGLVRAVRRFGTDAEAAGIAINVVDDNVALLPGVDCERGQRRDAATAHGSSKRLSTLQRNEHTGATVLLKGDSGDAASLFAQDRTGIRQRLRQHLAEHHQRSNNNKPPSPAAETPTRVPSSASGLPATADVLQQLDEGSHELARVLLAFDRYMRKTERFYAGEELGTEHPHAGEPGFSDRTPAHIRSAADARLVAYGKHLVAALAVLLQVLDDVDPYSAAVVAAAVAADPASAQAGPPAMVLAAAADLRTLRRRVSDGVGALVAATQAFTDCSFRYGAAAPGEDGQDDAEIPTAVPRDGVLASLARVSTALQALNHNTMALHIGAKRVVEACDVCDLRGLWLRISALHAAPNMLVSVPAGPAPPGALPTAAYAHRPTFRRSLSLPQLRRSALPAAVVTRPRADTIDAPSDAPPHLARRTESTASSPGEPEDAARTQALRDARVKDKLNRFFGDDPANFAAQKRPVQSDDLALTPVGSFQPRLASRTPTRATTVDDAPSAHGAQSIMSSRSSGKAMSSAQDQTPWYLSYESPPEDMLLSSDGQVKGSTLPALIERLVAHDVSDPNFVSTFLLTYHSFTSTPEFFECMFRRFLILPPAGLSEAELAEWNERKLKPVRLRVYNLFKTWLEQHYVEQVEGDPLGLEMLREFACTTMADYMSNAAEQLVRLIDKRRASQGGLRRMVPNLPRAAPPPMLPRSLSRLRLMDINPQELARQFTLIDSNLFNKVRPIECLKTAWSRKPGDPKAFNGLNTDIAVNVKAMSTLSTQTTLWVTANILLEHEIKRRAAVIKYFIAFAEHCRNLNNFNTLMSVLGALTSVPVERLTRTWQAVQQKSMVVYNQLRQIMRTDRNFAEYRDSLHSCNPPAIPFVGVYLQDLTFIEDGNDDIISTSPGLINFAKRQRTAGTIRDLQQFQNVPYNLTPVAEIQDWLLKRLEELCPNGQSSDRLVEEFWKMSTTLEPKEKDSERVLRLLKESGFL